MLRDMVAGLVVFFVAVPMCLGMALACGLPPAAGLIAGVVGGIVVGLLSKSQTSISGPAGGLIVVIAGQAADLGYPTFLLAVVVAGAIQILLGLARGGVLASFFPTSVTKAFLAAIGIILVLKQIPHILGHDTDPEGDFEFFQADQQNTFSEIIQAFHEGHPGAAIIGVLSIALLVAWNRIKVLKESSVPAAVPVILMGIGLGRLFAQMNEGWVITTNHFIQIPEAKTASDFIGFFQFPDFTKWNNPAVYIAAATIAAAASLETLLNLQAIDKIDPLQRTSPPSRELWAQGLGNIVCGLAGGLPITSVIVRSSVNVNAGGRTKLSAIFQGVLLLVSVIFLADSLNLIPLASVAAILLVTGFQLVSWELFVNMWAGGRYLFVPFLLTVVAIVLTDPLIGVLLGLAVASSFILWSNVRRPMRIIIEKHMGESVVHIELASQVSFLNRASLARALDEVPRGGQVLLDARGTDYVDPDIIELIREFKEKTALARKIEVSLLGFKSRYQLGDKIQYVDYSTRDLQSAMSPAQVLEILKAGHERFRTDTRLTRDLGRQVLATGAGQHPLAVVLSCIDSRSPAELIFDLGVGDIFSARIAGAVSSRKILGSIEFACAVAGAKLIVVMGHTRCGAVTAAVDLFTSKQDPVEGTGCPHITGVVTDIQKSIDPATIAELSTCSSDEKKKIVDGVARKNVARVVDVILTESPVIAELVSAGRIAVVGVMYDVTTGDLEFLPDAVKNLDLPEVIRESDGRPSHSKEQPGLSLGA